MKKTMLAALALAWLAPEVRAEEGSTNTLLLDSVLEAVREQNPSIKAARANWEAMKRRIAQERAWDDPMAGVDVERSETTRPDRFTDNEWMVAQRLPLSGKNRRRAKAAEADALASFEDLRRRELDMISRGRLAYYRLANGFEQLDLNRKNEGSSGQFLEISRSRYEVGKAAQSDVLMAETDLARLTENRFHLELQIADAASQLNALMNRPAEAALGRPERLSFMPLQAEPEYLLQFASTNRPEVLTAQRRIDAAKTRLDLARRYWIPDPEIRVEARQYNGRGGIQEYDTGIFFEVPWLNRSKYKAAIAEHNDMLEGARHELEAAERETSRQLQYQFKRIETFHHHTELFRNRIVPLAEQAVKASLAAYETDRGTFLELITAQRTLREVEAMYWTHLTDYLSAVAELEAIAGLNSQPTKGNQ